MFVTTEISHSAVTENNHTQNKVKPQPMEKTCKITCE